MSARKPKSSARKPRTSVYKFKSKFEKSFHELLKSKHLDFPYEADVLGYTLSLSYKPDWKVRDGLYLETKGKFDYIERRKLLAILRSNPGKEVRMVFQRNNKISKKSKLTYGDWCDTYGIKWSVFPELPL